MASSQNPAINIAAPGSSTNASLATRTFNELSSLLLQETATLQNGLVVLHALRLLVLEFHSLRNANITNRKVWISRLRGTVNPLRSQARTLRFDVGEVIVTMIRDAPWNVDTVRPGIADIASTTDAIYDGMARMIKQINAEKRAKVAQGVDVSQLDVPEMLSDDEDDDGEGARARGGAGSEDSEENASAGAEEEEDEDEEDGADEPNRGPRGAATSRGRGNFGHGEVPKWSVQERIALLKIYRDNTKLKAPRKTEMLNDNFHADTGISRTLSAVRQQIKALTDDTNPGDRAKLNRLIRDLER